MSEEQLRWLIIGCSAILLIAFVIVLIILLKRKNRIKESQEFPELLEAMGGKENITNLALNGSRISFNFENKKDLDKEKIKDNGVESIVVSNKKATLVIGKKAPIIYKYLNENIK